MKYARNAGFSLRRGLECFPTAVEYVKKAGSSRYFLNQLPHGRGLGTPELGRSLHGPVFRSGAARFCVTIRGSSRSLRSISVSPGLLTASPDSLPSKNCAVHLPVPVEDALLTCLLSQKYPCKLISLANKYCSTAENASVKQSKQMGPDQ